MYSLLHSHLYHVISAYDKLLTNQDRVKAEKGINLAQLKNDYAELPLIEMVLIK